MPEFTARHRIDTDARFVQEQDLRRAEQSASKAELLLHTSGELASQTCGEAREIREREQTLEGGFSRGAVQILEFSVEVEILLHGQILVQAEFLRHVAERAAQRLDLLARIAVEHPNRSRGRQEEPGEDAHERRLAGAVRSDESRHHASADLEAHVRKGCALFPGEILFQGRRARQNARPGVERDGACDHGCLAAFAALCNRTVTGMPWRRLPSWSLTITRKR